MPADHPDQNRLSFPARLLLAVILALLAIIVLQWVLSAVLGAIRFVLFIAVLLAAGFWVVSAKAGR